MSSYPSNLKTKTPNPNPVQYTDMVRASSMHHQPPGRGQPSRRYPQQYRPRSFSHARGQFRGQPRFYPQQFQHRRFSASSDMPKASLAKWRSEQEIFRDNSGEQAFSVSLPKKGLHTFPWSDSGDRNAALYAKRSKPQSYPKDTLLETRSKIPLKFPSPAITRRKSSSHKDQSAPDRPPRSPTASAAQGDQHLQWIEQWTPPPRSPTDDRSKNGYDVDTSEETSDLDMEGKGLSEAIQPSQQFALNGTATVPNDERGELNGEAKAHADTKPNSESHLGPLDPEKLPETPVSETASDNSVTEEQRVGAPDLGDKTGSIADLTLTPQSMPSQASADVDNQNPPDHPKSIESDHETEITKEMPSPTPDISSQPAQDLAEEPAQSQSTATDEGEVNTAKEAEGAREAAEASEALQDPPVPTSPQEQDFPHTPLNSIKEEEVLAEVPVWADSEKVKQHPEDYEKVMRFLKEHEIANDSSLPLSHNIVFYFSDTSTAKSKNANSYSATIRPMFVCETVWQFSARWRKFKERFSAPSFMLPNQNLYFFKQGIEPMWEDPVNARGGRITLSPTKMTLDELWEVVLCSFVGATCHNSIVGVVMSRRGRGDRIEIWMDEQGKEASEEVRAELSSMLPPIIQEVVQAAKYKKHFD
ncbi:hypothetical protein INT43_002575, partial [Umbelopsis isabellina]